MLIVVKVGGKMLREGVPPTFALDVKNLLSNGKVVVVHGGGVEVTEVASRLGVEQRFVVSPRGFRSRYTDKETIEVYMMVMAGRINKQIVLALQSHGIPSVGLSGLDGLLIQAKRKKRLVVIDERGRKRVIDGGYTGAISNINTHLLRLLIDGGYVPVVAPIAISEEFEPLNVDGDRAAARIAGALKADKLILLTDVQGLTLNGKLISKMSVSEARKTLQRTGHGMITKVYAALEAIEEGVSEVFIASGLRHNPITSSLRYEECTVITHE